MNPKEVKAGGPFVFFYYINMFYTRGPILVIEDFSQYYNDIDRTIKDKSVDVLIIDILNRVEYTLYINNFYIFYYILNKLKNIMVFFFLRILYRIEVMLQFFRSYSLKNVPLVELFLFLVFKVIWKKTKK